MRRSVVPGAGHTGSATDARQGQAPHGHREGVGAWDAPHRMDGRLEGGKMNSWSRQLTLAFRCELMCALLCGIAAKQESSSP